MNIPKHRCGKGARERQRVRQITKINERQQAERLYELMRSLGVCDEYCYPLNDSPRSINDTLKCRTVLVATGYIQKRPKVYHQYEISDFSFFKHLLHIDERIELPSFDLAPLFLEEAQKVENHLGVSTFNTTSYPICVGSSLELHSVITVFEETSDLILPPVLKISSHAPSCDEVLSHLPSYDEIRANSSFTARKFHIFSSIGRLKPLVVNIRPLPSLMRFLFLFGLIVSTRGAPRYRGVCQAEKICDPRYDNLSCTNGLIIPPVIRRYSAWRTYYNITCYNGLPEYSTTVFGQQIATTDNRQVESVIASIQSATAVTTPPGVITVCDEYGLCSRQSRDTG